MRAHVYEDPTGGGDDVILLIPEWARVPGSLRLYDPEGDPMEFEGATTDEGIEIPPDLKRDILDVIEER